MGSPGLILHPKPEQEWWKDRESGWVVNPGQKSARGKRWEMEEVEFETRHCRLAPGSAEAGVWDLRLVAAGEEVEEPEVWNQLEVAAEEVELPGREQEQSLGLSLIPLMRLAREI